MRRLVLLLVAAMLSATAPAAAERVALVIGVGGYRHVPPLANPPNDAEDVAAALTRLGFRTDLVTDPDRAQLEQAVRRLGQAARGAEAAIFFYAGHALEAGGRNWLLPVGANIGSERDLRFEALDMDIVTEQLDGIARLSIVLLDACRDNPFRLRLAAGTRSGATGMGLGRVHAAVGTLVAFSTAPGTVAADGSGRNSPFTAALLRRIGTPGLELRQMLAEVRRDVREATGGQQVPWEHSALEGSFYFSGGPPAIGVEQVFWESVRGSADRRDLEAYLARYPQGAFVDLARNRLRAMAAPTSPQGIVLTEDTLAAALATQLPLDTARRIAAAYLSERGPAKAIAINPARRRSFRVTAAAEGSDVAEMVLERCQLFYGSPCQLVGLDEELTPGRRPEPMPRLAHAGAFDPAQVPGQPASRRGPDSDLLRYAAGREHKAMAIHGTGRLYWRTGAASDEEAQEAALRACTEANERANREGPCLLYAVGDRVVLAERRRGIRR
ncbi:caspase family protein [Roseomonas eburnea]|uniref:Caspase family protein n=1 Tax=Neoroseomonas eburnea TaxID=1346889 RepID=A0A9X9XF28_9PROT|nr:caspase family protein [Neoroseomonas eburnea]MBR0682314.1 caspase family protein [Neoroseomonas eburnea]